MPETPADPRHPEITRQHHAAQVRTSAVRAKAGLEQILHDLARGRVVRSSGRLIAAEVTALCEAIALLAEAEKAAARPRGEAAA